MAGGVTWLLSGCCGSPGDHCDASVQVFDAAGTPVPSKEFSLRVINANDFFLDEEQVKVKLGEAESILMGRDGGEDDACCVRFGLDQLRMFGDLPEFLEEEPDYNLMRPGGNPVGAFAIVKKITWCLVPKEKPTGGCTVVGQFPSVISKNQSGLVWAHEFGHAQGHNGTGCSSPDRGGFFALMCDGLSEPADIRQQRTVSPTDCRTNFRRSRNVAGVISTAEGTACE